MQLRTSCVLALRVPIESFCGAGVDLNCENRGLHLKMKGTWAAPRQVFWVMLEDLLEFRVCYWSGGFGVPGVSKVFLWFRVFKVVFVWCGSGFCARRLSSLEPAELDCIVEVRFPHGSSMPRIEKHAGAHNCGLSRASKGRGLVLRVDLINRGSKLFNVKMAVSTSWGSFGGCCVLIVRAPLFRSTLRPPFVGIRNSKVC